MMHGEVAVRILGPVEVRQYGGWRRPATPQQRLILSVLALRAGQVVDVEQLIDTMWENDPPRSAKNGVQVIMTHLRKMMTETSWGQLTRLGSGYRLNVDQVSVDVHEFRRLVERGRGISRGSLAIGDFASALEMWRGDALADSADTASARQIRRELARERLAVLEDHAQALLRWGRHREAAVKLSSLQASYPLSESLAGLLMLAYYRCGECAEALRVFRETREVIVSELGIEPGPELQRIHFGILARDASEAMAMAWNM
jgi:DNA-binding SARP family transcriptional activator